MRVLVRTRCARLWLLWPIAFTRKATLDTIFACRLGFVAFLLTPSASTTEHVSVMGLKGSTMHSLQASCLCSASELSFLLLNVGGCVFIG